MAVKGSAGWCGQCVLWVRRGQVLAGSSEGWWPPIQQPICVAYEGTDASEGNGNKYRTECFLKEQTVCFKKKIENIVCKKKKKKRNRPKHKLRKKCITKLAREKGMY